ncbi:glycerate kinase [Sporosarcina jiandibaonis]|uniref:glycerate kinase n=1 Tax=Sporosarcina jiandibaonis TaxID=2715535 RepID=UPI00155345C6|nr:glycerate kinase [Sporosarcina jiandibaonis]
MKIIIAPDSFKGSLSAVEVAKAINKGVKNAYADAKTYLLPVADGGEGTMETLVAATNGKIQEVVVVGPLGNEVKAAYGILGDGETCVIEMAVSSGLALVPEGKLAPLDATTYGAGQLIKQALNDGFSSFVIALGGSATNDGGAGMLQALGLKLLDKMGKEVGYGGGELAAIEKIDTRCFDPRIKNSKFLIASDVQNPLIGLNGASHIFGPQKGASPEDVKILDENMRHWADLIAGVTGISLHDLLGAGAAGGIGGAFQAFFPAKMERGVDVVLEYVKFHSYLKDADLVITGEGQVDYQTASGKTPLGVAQAAISENVPSIILAGAVGEGVEVLYDYGVVSVHSIIDRPMTLSESMKQTAILLEKSAEQIIRSYFYSLIKELEGGRLI